jgi:hypothetical protein
MTRKTYPTQILIDREGRVVERFHIGDKDHVERLEKLLADE